MSTPASLLHSANAISGGFSPASLDAPPHWKAELNARLREHRERRSESASGPEPSGESRAADGSAAMSRVAARVAERYSKAPTYQQVLKASASAAASAAETAVEAALEAHAAAQAVLEELEFVEPAPVSAMGTNSAAPANPFDDPFFTQDPREAVFQPVPAFKADEAEADKARGKALNFVRMPIASTVEHHEPLPARSVAPRRTPAIERTRALVDAFAEAVVPAAQALPAKLIEFPRELIAPRKQRPRLAEGPLFEEEAPGGSLRIFEVEVEKPVSLNAAEADSMEYRGTAPVITQETRGSFLDGDYGAMGRERNSDDEEDMPRRRATFHFGTETVKPQPQNGWGAIRLGEHPQPETEFAPAQKQARRPEHGYSVETEPALHELAPITDRMMAALIDAGIVFGCFLLSVLVFASCTVHPPAGKGALAIGFLVLGVLGAFYGWLFMTHGGGSTPGMRYARIALCSFSDENPTRKDLQNRIAATALALLPLGLGLFWALLDEDKLGWHDRMTRTYQRSYR